MPPGPDAIARYLRSPKGKETRRRGDNKRLARFVELMKALKEGKPCMDCGGTFPLCAMEFDHRPGEVKRFNISNSANRAVRTVLKEIEKCDLVCANCHRIRTHNRGTLREYHRRRREGKRPSIVTDQLHMKLESA